MKKYRLCGGCWFNLDPSWVRASFRYGFTRSVRDNGVGLRLIQKTK